MTQPISPSDVPNAKVDSFPDKVIVAWNGLIVRNAIDGRSVVTQEEAIETLCHVMGVDRAAVFVEKWLDIEDVFRASGWKVVYDKPSYCDDYDPTFTFTPAG